VREHQTGSNRSIVLSGVAAILVALLSGCGVLPSTTSGSSDKGQAQTSGDVSASPLAQSPAPKATAPASSTTRAAAQPAAGPRTICISLTRHDQVGANGQDGEVVGSISGVDNVTLTMTIDGKPAGQQVTANGGTKVKSPLAFGGKHVIELTAVVNAHVVGSAFDKSDWDSGVSTCATIKGEEITALNGLAFANSQNDMEETLLLVPDEGMGSLASGGKDDYLTGDGKVLSPTDWHAVPASGHVTETEVQAFGPPVPAGQSQTVATILDARLDAGALVNN